MYIKRNSQSEYHYYFLDIFPNYLYKNTFHNFKLTYIK